MLLERFWTHVKKLVDERASAKDRIALCDQLRDTHLREPGHLPRGTGPAVAHHCMHKSLLAAQAERESAAAAKREDAEAEKKRLMDEQAKLSHRQMVRTEENKE